MLNYYLLVCVRRGVELSVDVFRLLFEMKLLDRYDCYVVFFHRDRGLPSHDHFKIPKCPSSNSGWKNRYFFVKSVTGNFPFPLDWGVPPLEEFNSTPILSEQEIDSLIILRATEPLGRSMNDALTDDALVSASIGRPYDMSVDQFTEDFLEELARKNSRGQRKRRRDNRPIPSPSSDVALISGQQATESAESQEARGVTEQLCTPESSRPRSPRVVSESLADLSYLFSHSAFRKIRDQAGKIDQTSRMLEEKSRKLRDRRRELVEKTEMLSQDLAEKEKIAIEEYKGSEEYMTTVGMVGVRGREMDVQEE
ncbi:Uncharacterized protein Adt_15648 [Abeliophyllum distichum]|uniref:Uncharacterized protein n=1 Tax=Abeliophyllum distichum TaxID=126358 RepID=A0ABD1U319_9LAMI